MLIKPKYSHGDSTAPMTFYKIQRFFLPFSMLYFAFRGFSDVMDLIHIAQDNSFSAYSVFVLLYASVYYLGTIVLWAFALNGLVRMEWSGPRCMFWGCFWSAGQTIVQYALGWFTSEQAGSSLVSALVLLGIVYVYYSKRRNLFTPLHVQREPAPAPAQPIVETPQPSSPPPEPVFPPAPEDTGEQMVLPEFAPPAPEPPKKKQLFFPILSAVLALVCVASLAANIIMGVQFGQQAIALKKAQNRATAYKTEIKNTEYKLDTISSVTRFAYYDDNMLKYHRFDCTDHPFDGNKVNAVHSPWYFERLGYTPCRFCGAGNYDDLEFSPYTFFTREELQLLHKEGR